MNLSWGPEQYAATLQVGLGYPDLRLRYDLSGPIDIELKVAVEQGEQAYGGRLYWRITHAGPVGLLAGGEAGYLNFSSVDSISGDGDYGELFVGAQWTFVKNWTALVDYGLAKIQVRSEGLGVTELQWVINTALYYTLF